MRNKCRLIVIFFRYLIFYFKKFLPLRSRLSSLPIFLNYKSSLIEVRYLLIHIFQWILSDVIKYCIYLRLIVFFESFSMKDNEDGWNWHYKLFWILSALSLLCIRILWFTMTTQTIIKETIKNSRIKDIFTCIQLLIIIV